MAQMTWRTTDELLERVRRQAEQRGRSLNEWVSAVLDAATNPETAGSDAERIRERLADAGLLADAELPSPTPTDPTRLAAARAAAGQGTPLAEFVAEGRR